MSHERPRHRSGTTIEKLRKDYAYASYHEANEIWQALDRIAVHVYPSEEL